MALMVLNVLAQQINKGFKMTTTKANIKHLLKATFPEYKGRKFYVNFCNQIGFHDLNWGGGTRVQYRACTINGESIQSRVDLNAAAPWNNPMEGVICAIPEGVVIASHGYFCGKECGVSFHVNPVHQNELSTSLNLLVA